jgi:hypothetical protein
MQGKKLCGFVAAIASLGEAGALGSRTTEAPSAALGLFWSCSEQHTTAQQQTALLLV